MFLYLLFIMFQNTKIKNNSYILKIHRIVHSNVEKMLHAAVCRKHKKIVDNRQSLKHKL